MQGKTPYLDAFHAVYQRKIHQHQELRSLQYLGYHENILIVLSKKKDILKTSDLLCVAKSCYVI